MAANVVAFSRMLPRPPDEAVRLEGDARTVTNLERSMQNLGSAMGLRAGQIQIVLMGNQSSSRSCLNSSLPAPSIFSPDFIERAY